MNHSPEMQEVLEVIRKENRHTQFVFGGGIIVLSIVLMIIAPGGIRSFMEHWGPQDNIIVPLDLETHGNKMMKDQSPPAAPTSTTTKATAPLQ